MSGAEIDRRKVRLGLIVVSVVVLAAVVLFFAIGDALGKAVMFAVALVGIVRMALLVKSLRDDAA